MRNHVVRSVTRYDWIFSDGQEVSDSVQEAKEECAVCGEKISDDHVSSNNAKFHPQCMKVSITSCDLCVIPLYQCQVCGDQVRGKYLTYKDLPICEKDFRVSGQLLVHVVTCHEAEGGPRVQRV